MSQASSLPTDPVLTKLREDCETGNLVIFAGAGVSAAAGLPSWKWLVELLTNPTAAATNSSPYTSRSSTT